VRGGNSALQSSLFSLAASSSRDYILGSHSMQSCLRYAMAQAEAPANARYILLLPWNTRRSSASAVIVCMSHTRGIHHKNRPYPAYDHINPQPFTYRAEPLDATCCKRLYTTPSPILHRCRLVVDRDLFLAARSLSLERTSGGGVIIHLRRWISVPKPTKMVHLL
jgi:hypothetical protein